MGKRWTASEINYVVDAVACGMRYCDIAKALGRSKDSVRKMGSRIFRGKNVIASTRLSLCWLCRKAGHCQKPVEGSVWYEKMVNEGVSLIVKQCPLFSEEPWVKKYGRSELQKFYYTERRDSNG